MKAKNVAGFRIYDSSEFAAVSPLLDDDEALEGLWKKEYSLAELVAADQFKSYDDLKKRLDSVLRVTSTRQDPEVADEDAFRGSAPNFESRRTAEATAEVTAASDSDDDDDTMSYFRQLAEA